MCKNMTQISKVNANISLIYFKVERGALETDGTNKLFSSILSPKNII